MSGRRVRPSWMAARAVSGQANRENFCPPCINRARPRHPDSQVCGYESEKRQIFDSPKNHNNQYGLRHPKQHRHNSMIKTDLLRSTWHAGQK